MNDINDRLASMLANREGGRDPKDFFLDLADLVARGAAEDLGRQVDEIGILIASPDGKHLRFIAPRKLCDLGTIPTTKRDSIAVSVFTKKVGEANNNVPLARHVAFFESVKVTEKVLPIMKMVTVPIVADGQIVGVAQVSKKGDSLRDAGPDFNAADVRKVTEYFDSKAAFLLAARPERF
ncbi:MAG: hypothetical protein JJE39_02165 [Vicinamibacteria bacterium]|nr:hypothetical protein [Vicinamibacteria bacterium]